MATPDSVFRVAVEILLRYEGQILLAKRADDCAVSPAQWSVPAGKAKYTEIPHDAAVREAKEETGLDVDILRELSCHTVTLKKGNEDIYRLVFVYLVQMRAGEAIENLRRTHEHSAFAWVDARSVDNPDYQSLRPEMRQMIKAALAEG